MAEFQRELVVANMKDGLASAEAREAVGDARLMLTEDQTALAQRLSEAATALFRAAR